MQELYKKYLTPIGETSQTYGENGTLTFKKLIENLIISIQKDLPKEHYNKPAKY